MSAGRTQWPLLVSARSGTQASNVSAYLNKCGAGKFVTGERENVLVIQDHDGKKTYTRVNLKSDELFSSPVYYLSQNDVVYVEPNKARAKNSSIGAQTGVILTSLSLLISMTALVVTILNNQSN